MGHILFLDRLGRPGVARGRPGVALIGLGPRAGAILSAQVPGPGRGRAGRVVGNTMYEHTVSALALMGQCKVQRVSSESRRVENKAVKMGMVYCVEWWYWK